MNARVISTAIWRGAALSLCAVSLVLPGLSQTQTFTVLHSFLGPEGALPKSGLAMDGTGNLYGAAQYGGGKGSTLCVYDGCGVIFKLDAHGTETVLYSFTGKGDGRSPWGVLWVDSVGNIYGTTSEGGDLSCSPPISPNAGCGVVFELPSSNPGSERVLHSFNGTDGMDPAGGVIQDAAGNLYGTTEMGGASNAGVVFKLDLSSGVETVLYSFTGAADGSGPRGRLVQDSNGNLYGTTVSGGDLSGCSGYGCGVVFKVDANGVETVLYAFTGGSDGSAPSGSLVRDASGNFFGITQSGGDLSACGGSTPLQPGCGVVFKLDPSGTQTVLYTFTGGGDGAEASTQAWPGQLVQDVSGNLYGVAPDGGGSGVGVLFKVNAAGSETVLHTFNIDDGSNPTGSLFLDSAGNLYGITSQGAGRFNLCPNGCGAVFKFGAPVPPPSDFSLTASALAPNTVVQGGSSTSTIDIAAVAGFSGSVALSCSVQPAPSLAPRCSLSPNSTNAGTPATLTVATTGPSATLHTAAGAGLFYAMWMPLLGIVGLKLGLASDRKRWKGKALAVFLSCALVASLASQIACGGGNRDITHSRGTPAGSYTVTVTGISGSLQHSVTTTLTVQ
jgi:uncharacterized repeat protein (TIGR03803 family)